MRGPGDGRFTGRVVLVAGGGSGIGRATACAFAGEGAAVLVAGRTAERLAESVALIGISYLRGRGGGVIVNVASNLGARLRVPGMAAYAATKAAVAALTRTAAIEYARDGVRITAISPGVTATEMSLWPGQTSADREAWARQMVPNGRVATPAEVAAAVLWVASDECRFGVGLDLVFDGGASA